MPVSRPLTPLRSLWSLALVLIALPAAAQTTLSNVPIPVSDGETLNATVSLPSGSGPFPVIVTMTPYGPITYVTDYVSHGYVHVNVDVRGTGGSTGSMCFTCEREQQDAVEAIGWAGTQPWSTGNVGMTGGSYMAFLQLHAAAKQPPHLKAIVPRVAWSDPYRDAARHNGIFTYSMLLAFTVTQPIFQSAGMSVTADKVDTLYNTNAFTTTRGLPFDGPWYWERAIYPKYGQISVPALFIGGWFDVFNRGTTRNFTGVASSQKKMIMGPWTHRRAGGLPESEEPYPDEHVLIGGADPILAWFDRWLKGIDNGIETGDRVHYFDTGTLNWKAAAKWPPQGTKLVTYYLSSAQSQSAVSVNDGSLVDAAPAVADSATYAADITTGLAETTSEWNAVFLTPWSRQDQRTEELTSLTYTTAEMTQPLTLAGPMELNFWGSTLSEDTDWIVKVTDVHPDGTSLIVTAGYVRASHRTWDNSLSGPAQPWLVNQQAAPVPFAQPVEYRVDIWTAAHTIKPGHRLRVNLSANDLPNHEPLVGLHYNTVHHGQSRLILTVLP